jgi:hypothetical protein
MEESRPESGDAPGDSPSRSIRTDQQSRAAVVHVIRLRGGWQTIPDGERVLHSRNFGRPRTLDPNERLWLVCARVPGPAEVILNGGEPIPVVESGPVAVDITESLRPRNVVVFRLAFPEPLGEVELEIRLRTE